MLGGKGQSGDIVLKCPARLLFSIGDGLSFNGPSCIHHSGHAGDHADWRALGLPLLADQPGDGPAS